MPRNNDDLAHDNLEKRNRELSILNVMAQALNAEIDLQQALQTTLEQAVHLFSLKTGWIWLIHEDTAEPYLAAALNLPPVLVKNPKLMEGTVYCHCLDTYQAGKLEEPSNVSTVICTRLKGLIDGTEGLRHHASIPLYTQHGDKLGMLNVVSDDWAELSTEDLRLLTIIGDMLSLAVERARLYQNSTRIGILEERNRLAREIHDTLAQGLTAISLQLETVDTLLDMGAEKSKLQTIIQQALTLTRTNLDEARRSVLDLRAAPLEGRTLSEAVQLYAGEFAHKNGLELTLTIGDSPPLAVRVEIGLYRIMQEALTNIAKHAKASNLTIDLSILPHQAQLRIRDNGCGFDTESYSEESFGLIGMNERVHLLDGELEISSTLGEGTRIEVTIPLEMRHE